MAQWWNGRHTALAQPEATRDGSSPSWARFYIC